MDYQLISVKEEDNCVVVCFMRPDKRNALNTQMRSELSHCLNEESKGKDVVIFTGEGSAFCAGLDLQELPKAEDVQQFMNILKMIYESNAIFIAAINGPARGGGAMLVNACDVAYSVASATFGLPEVILESSINSFSSTEQKELSEKSKTWQGLTGRVLSAQDAKEEGLINDVVLNEDILEFTSNLIPQLDVQQMKKRKAKTKPRILRNTLVVKQSIISKTDYKNSKDENINT